MGHGQETISWETELWDAFPQLSSNVLQSINWLQRFDKISTGLHKLNKDYGKGLAKLVKKEVKSGEEGDSVGVCHKALMQHLLDLAGRHKQIAVSLGTLAKEYQGETKRLIEEHKTVETEAKKLQGDLDSSIGKLSKSKEKFVKRQIEAENAEDSLNKAEPDTMVSRAELEKLKENADDRRARANRSREEYSQQLLLTNSHQKGFYRETWPKMFTKIHQIGKDAGVGIDEMLSKLVSGGLDQWPEPVEAWGEIDNSRELLDFKGDFASFVIWSKSGNPYPKGFTFTEPPKNSGSFTPLTTMGTLRRSISRQSLRYRTSTFPRNSAKFPSMFSLRNGSFKSHRRSQSNIEKSTETIDQIEEEETGNVKKQVALTVSQELKLLTSTINSYVEDEAEVSSHPNNTESTGGSGSCTNIDVEIESEPEKTSTSPESEQEKDNPFENTDELNNNCDMRSTEEKPKFYPTKINLKINGIKKDNPFEPIQASVKEKEIECDINSVKDIESCENILETKTDTTKMIISDKMEKNEDDDNNPYKNDVDIDVDVDSNDTMSISARSYKYDDRKNPFMDEVFDDSLTTA